MWKGEEVCEGVSAVVGAGVGFVVGVGAGVNLSVYSRALVRIPKFRLTSTTQVQLTCPSVKFCFMHMPSLAFALTGCCSAAASCTAGSAPTHLQKI